MKALEPIDFSLATCARELDEFRALLDAKDELSEEKDVLPFFRERRHLSAFIGSISPSAGAFDLLAYEYDLFGDFACDLVVGNSRRHAYVLLEFEDAAAQSVFQKTTGRHAPEWGRRFERGYSQIVDWLWKLDDQRSTSDFKHRFGKSEATFSGLLVIGRSRFLAPREQQRLSWRMDRVVVNSIKVSCLTFDDLYQELHTKMDHYQRYVGGAE